MPFLFHAPYSVSRLKTTLKHCRKSETWGQVSLFCRGESRFSKKLGQFSQGHMASDWSRGSPTADGGVHVLSVCISVPVMPDKWLKTLLRKGLLQISIADISWELDSYGESQMPPHNAESGSSFLQRSPGDLYMNESLRSIETGHNR